MRNPNDVILLALFATGRLSFHELSSSDTRDFEQDTILAIEAVEEEFGITIEQFQTIADAMVQLAGSYEAPDGRVIRAFSSDAEDDNVILLYPTQIDGEALEVNRPHIH